MEQTETLGASLENPATHIQTHKGKKKNHKIRGLILRSTLNMMFGGDYFSFNDFF